MTALVFACDNNNKVKALSQHTLFAHHTHTSGDWKDALLQVRDTSKDPGNYPGDYPSKKGSQMRITISKDEAVILLEGIRLLGITSIPEGRDHNEYGQSLRKLREKMKPVAEAEKGV